MFVCVKNVYVVVFFFSWDELDKNETNKKIFLFFSGGGQPLRREPSSPGFDSLFREGPPAPKNVIK